LIELAADGDWRAKLPIFGGYAKDPFDYSAEDMFLRGLRVKAGGERHRDAAD
jgi:hypothetical protein